MFQSIFYLEYGYWVVILYLYLYNSTSREVKFFLILPFVTVTAVAAYHAYAMLSPEMIVRLLRLFSSKPLFKTGYFISSTIKNMIYIYIAHYTKSSHYITTILLLILISYIFKKINHIIDPIYINYELTKIDDFGKLVKKYTIITKNLIKKYK